MKKISRMLIFSAVALYLTSLWNKGFRINFNPTIFIQIVLLITVFYYFVMPIARLILLPINWLTLGFLSSILYFLLFYFFITRFSLVQIKPWDFPGLTFYSITIKSFHVGYLLNILLSSLSLSFIINFLEAIL
ncbi:phage holin family protein [Candidatus Roizmanbacteria bacterium]|nr:phage holin family protein [Candidatus Roizmanbacteria bacterium]